MIWKFVVLYLAMVTISCGRIAPSEVKIIGGRPIAEHKPWFVQLLDNSNSPEGFCGGTLVAPRIIITAAHCLEPEFTKNLHVALGMADGINLNVNHPVRVEGIVVHPQYSTTDMKNDIAVLYLADYKGVQFERPVKPIHFSRDAAMPESLNQNVTVVGLGNTTSIGQIFDGVIREVDLPIVELKKCTEVYTDAGEKHICAGNVENGGADSCQGDSGGPMVVKNKRGQLELVGVVSYGNGCAQKNAPGVYTRVASHVDFIDAAVNELSIPRQDSNMTGELERLLKTRCMSQFGFIPFEQTSAESNKRRTIYGMDLSALKISKSEKIPTGETIDQCEFETNGSKVRAEWKLLGGGQRSSAAKVAVVVSMNNGDHYVSQPQRLVYHQDSLICSSSMGPISLADQRQFTYVQFKDVVYGLGDPVDHPDDNQTTWGCSIGDASIEVYEINSSGAGSHDLAARIHHRSLGTISVKLLRMDQEIAIAAQLVMNDAANGVLTIKNSSKEDLFTWQMTCNDMFKLKLRAGDLRLSEPNPNGAGHRISFDSALDAEGTIRAGGVLKLDLESPSVNTLTGCTINDALLVEFSRR